ncbi:MAG: hypothetical protein CMD66_00325 [Gammaproteobacteria bacterium]|nr:hypothetical protein [Gammaproteobacteria bacterium]|tara:strand:+ start:104 stop:652 length:549 start_codon:yes stop_codon:yes gene_type:complete
MNQQIVDQLAKDILSLTEKEEPSQQNIGIRGTELIQEFIQKPGVEDSLAELDIRKKVRLWGSQGSGIQILLHGADTPKRGSPHDHGQSWALYFQVSGVTEMSTYNRISGVPGRPGRAVLEKTDQTDLTPGNAMFFGPLVIHSTQHSAPPARWIRVTGTDLDYVERLRFSIERQEAVIEKKNS